MRENQETSELSALGSGADRPEKAESRTSGVDGTEESDCAVVPGNLPNKGEPPRGGLSAEVREGRKSCPRGWRVCAKQREDGRESGSRLCSVI